MTENDASQARVGILTVSDRASSGVYEDRGGPAIRKYLEEHFHPVIQVGRIVPDEQDQVESNIRDLTLTCCLVLTTGGTGPAPRDITPEATEVVCQKMLPGFGEVMRAVSVAKVPTAILSRQTAGICNKSLVVNLPGNPKAIAECLDPVFRAMPHAIHHAGNSQKLRLLPAFHPTGKNCEECGVKH